MASDRAVATACPIRHLVPRTVFAAAETPHGASLQWGGAGRGGGSVHACALRHLRLELPETLSDQDVQERIAFRREETGMTGDITQLLAAAREGDRSAFGRLFDLAYHELRRIARGQRCEGGETLRATALVHETYLKMAQGAALPPEDRGHFFSTATRAMRQIVVDRARRRNARKRGAGTGVEPLEEEPAGTGACPEEILGIDRALQRLERLDPRLVRLVELRYYAGLSVEETAEALALSERTVKRDWRRARAFLFQELSGCPLN